MIDKTILVNKKDCVGEPTCAETSPNLYYGVLINGDSSERIFSQRDCIESQISLCIFSFLDYCLLNKRIVIRVEYGVEPAMFGLTPRVQLAPTVLSLEAEGYRNQG